MQCESGLINGGIYIVQRSILKDLQSGFSSFEVDFMQSHINSTSMFGYINDSYFIDIGIPEDYERAQQEMVQFK